MVQWPSDLNMPKKFPIDQSQDLVLLLKGKYTKVVYLLMSKYGQLFGLVMRGVLVGSGAVADRLEHLEGA